MYLTNFERDDGFGAQLQTIIFTAFFCELKGLEFIYSPLKAIAHNYNNDPDFVIKKENFLNLSSAFRTIDQVTDCPPAPYDIFQEVENNLEFCLQGENIKKIKNCIRKNNSFNLEGVLNIAVHVRRRNQHDNNDLNSVNYYSEDSYFLNVMNFIRETDNQRKIFHIYSQGNLEDFKNFEAEDTVFHLNEEIEKTFLGMITANILIMSRSSLSYTAALLSEGTIYYLSFWHNKAPHWKTL